MKDELKKEFTGKVAAGETGWKIKTRKNGPELVRKERLFVSKTNQLFLAYTNADCLLSKWDEFVALVQSRKPHVIVVTEVLPKNCGDPF
jgi:hypothetical protein